MANHVSEPDCSEMFKLVNELMKAMQASGISEITVKKTDATLTVKLEAAPTT